MIGKIFSYFKGGNDGKVSLKDALSGLKLVGSFHKKVIGGQTEMMGEECTLTMSIVNENTFDFNLNVDNDEYQYSNTWETISFAITNDRGFKFCLENGKECLIWEFNRDFFIFYLFNDDINTKNKNPFLNYLVNLIATYEYADNFEKISKLEDNDSYLTQLDDVENISQFLEENYGKIYSELNKKDSLPLSKSSSEKISENKINVDPSKELTEKMDKLKITQLSFKKSFPTAKCLFESKGILHKYDKNKDELLVISENAALAVYSIEAFKFYLVVDEYSTEHTHTCTDISQDINLITNRNENLIMWLSKESFNSNERTAYNFVFYEDNKSDLFRKVIAKTQYETSTTSKYEDLKEEDQQWLENENMPDSDYDDEKIENVEMEMENEFQESESDQRNKVTAQAYLHDRTFVVRANNTIGVYKTDEDDTLSHLANLPAVVQYEDKNLDIKNAQMFYSDTNMILLDKNNPNSAFRYDLGKGKIVEEWTAEDMKKIEALAQEKKFSQMTDNQILIGVNNNNLFTMDARINKKNKVVATKTYKTNPKMNTLVTTNFGGIATGSTNGEIRLYNEVGKNAKTLLPLFGDPPKSLDTTADGKYLLVTCDKYMIVIPTTCKGDKNGFNAQMGKEKPNPRTLKIKPIDINKYGLEKLSFTPAKFNVDQNNGETNIITSLGDYVVIWNFSKIKKGIYDDYKIKKVNQHIIENQFKYNRNQIVVTMDNKLRIQNQKTLQSDN